MSEINCNNCAISDFKESLCDRCDEMKRLGRAEDIEKLLIKAFSEVDSQAKSDCISRQRAIKAINTWDKFGVDERGRLVRWHEGLVLYVRLRDVLTAIVNLPSAQPEITLESAIDYLRNIGWMQEHDRIMSASAQPERQINLDGTPIEILSELRSQFNCFDEQEEKVYHALSVAIHALSAQPERTSPCADCQEFDCYGCDERENRYE